VKKVDGGKFRHMPREEGDDGENSPLLRRSGLAGIGV